MLNTQTEPKKRRCAAYLRVSTDEQAREGYGLDAQLFRIKEFIKNKEYEGWVFDETLIYKDDGYSGTLQTRPALDKMMRDAKNKKFEIILVYKVDRLYRNMIGLLKTIEELGNNKVGFASVTEPINTTVVASSSSLDLATGGFLLQIFGALAEFERNLILGRTIEGKLASAKDGNYVGGNIPMGYDLRDKKLIINKEEARWVRKIFAWYVSQNYSKGDIAKKLTDMRVTANIDKKLGSKRKVNPSHFWDAGYVRTILRGTIYIGVYYYNKKGKGKDGKLYNKPHSEWIEFSCPPIIDQGTFKKAQIKLDTDKSRSNNAHTTYLLSGKIQCALCGSMFTGYTSAKKTKN